MIVLAENRYRVFGSPTFRGNPVTLFEVDGLDDSTALLHAAQKSTTQDNVFFTQADGEAAVQARFFSSSAELWLCGHGLLALSHHLYAPDITGTRVVHSSCGTPDGAVHHRPSCRTWHIYADAQGPGVLMPAQRGIEIDDPMHWMKQSLRGIGIEHERLYRCPNEVWVVVLRDMADLMNIQAEAVAALPCGNNTPGALIAALPLPDARYGFRYFAPWHGKREDSGTGSAHSYIAPLMMGSPDAATALQFSPAGMAEMRVGLHDDRVSLSGRVAPYD